MIVIGSKIFSCSPDRQRSLQLAGWISCNLVKLCDMDDEPSEQRLTHTAELLNCWSELFGHDELCALEEQPTWEMAKLQYKLGTKDVKRPPTFHIRPPNIKDPRTTETAMYAMTPAAAQKLSKRLTEPIKPRQLDSRHGILRGMLNASQVLHAVPAVAFQGHEWGTDIQINRRGESPCKIDVCK